MKKLIVNADDLGYREGINKGIISALQTGIVTSASMFVERDGSEEAVRLVRENPTLGIGPHIDLDKFFDVNHHAGIIENGKKLDIPAIKGEIRRQLDKFYSFGFIADHLDSHHHAHLHPEVFGITCELCREFKIPVIRLAKESILGSGSHAEYKRIITENGLRTIDHFIEGWYWGNVDEQFEIAELMTHPGYGELWREAELAHCCQLQLKQYLIDNQIDLLRFSDAISS
jgi:hypothetical protein